MTTTCSTRPASTRSSNPASILEKGSRSPAISWAHPQRKSGALRDSRRPACRFNVRSLLDGVEVRRGVQRPLFGPGSRSAIGVWRIARRSVIYEKDRIESGRSWDGKISLDPALLGALSGKANRHLAYLQTKNGRPGGIRTFRPRCEALEKLLAEAKSAGASESQ